MRFVKHHPPSSVYSEAAGPSNKPLVITITPQTPNVHWWLMKWLGGEVYRPPKDSKSSR